MRRLTDFEILVHPLLLNSTKAELAVLAVTVAAIITFSLTVAKKEIRKRQFDDDK